MGSRLTVDGSTLALWQANGTGDLIDATGNYPLTKHGVIASAAGFVGNAVVLDNNLKNYTHPGDAALRNLPLADFSIEVLVKMIPGSSVWAPGGSVFFTLEDPASTAWGVLGYVFAEFALIGGGGPSTGIAGFSQTPNNPTPSIAQVWASSNEYHYFVLIFRQNYPGGGSSRLFFHVDGVPSGINNELAGPVGISAFAGGQLMIGNYWGTANTPEASDNKWCHIEEIRLSTVARTQAEIKANWLAYQPASGVDSTLPVVTNVTPATGTPIGKFDSVAFRVTDSGGNLTRTKVVAYYPGVAAFEVVYYDEAISGTGFSGGFAPQYSGSRSVITDGFQFSDVKRHGGWPSVPHLVVLAADAVGNESA